MTCTECGMSRKEWDVEEELNPNGRPCCDEEPIADESLRLPSETAPLVTKLLVLPSAIARVEEAVLAAEIAHRRSERSLQRCQDSLLLDGGIDGKNAELRAAQLRYQTEGASLNVDRALECLQARKITLRLLHNQHASLRAIARLQGGAL